MKIWIFDFNTLYIILFLIISFNPGYSFDFNTYPIPFPYDDNKTMQYINSLNLSQLELNGINGKDPFFENSRNNSNNTIFDTNYDFDFYRLFLVSKELEGVNRSYVLKLIFEQLTFDSQSNINNHYRVLQFLQKIGIHNPYVQPMYPNRQMVTDPLILLELQEMRCGHVARLAGDIFSSAGYNVRLVQLGGHVIAEIFYDDNWHYFDADLFSNSGCIMINGSIPSVLELCDNISSIDSIPFYYLHDNFNNVPICSIPYYSYYYCSNSEFIKGNYFPQYYYKMGSSHDWEKSLYYGWDNYYSEIDNERNISSIIYYQPSTPDIIDITERIEKSLKFVNISWTVSDYDNDIVGYNVYLSLESRGWNYINTNLDSNLIRFKSNTSYNLEQVIENSALPKKYNKKFVTDSFMVISKSSDMPLYLSIMAVDKHGLDVGRTIFPLSEELVI